MFKNASRIFNILLFKNKIKLKQMSKEELKREHSFSYEGADGIYM
jgi:hypothetical protein